MQEKLRAEVNQAWERVKARGDGEFAADDFDNMPYLVAVAKVQHVIRGHSIDDSDLFEHRKPSGFIQTLLMLFAFPPPMISHHFPNQLLVFLGRCIMNS